ncbi:MAG: putative type I restriction enzymeP M protein [Chroococcopsis gigantea SAG 12.99]|jgi:type I restriction enzyme M protein|nr:N-6 DNA methylase [Chlorogloea purpurea SAG 13.99]MDV2999773.1 putative type I restriction enzymeP M protein [Chroococcopsis gigantea SAG 12.99]
MAYNKGTKGKTFATQQGLNSYIKNVCDIMRRSNCAGALQYVPELSWILFLKILDDTEQREAEEAEAVGDIFQDSISEPYRWRDWAAPNGTHRLKLQMGQMGQFIPFINDEVIPYLKQLKDPKKNPTPRQKIISEVMSNIERVRIDTEANFLDILDKVHEMDYIDPTHIFPISQVYEGLLLKMGEKNNDGGQFFTPREVVRAMIKAIDPQVGEKIYDPCCGTGGFLAQSYEYIRDSLKDQITPEDLDTLKLKTFYGREKENLIYPIALANLVLHGIDRPHIWHGNTLNGEETYGELFKGAPELFDIILTNPPFGGKEHKTVQAQFAYKTSATQVLFLQHVINNLANGGRCAIVLDEGVLFRTNENAFVQTKRKLLNDCDLWCIVSLPPGTFIAAGGGVKANILFFTKGKPTEQIWYYDLSDIKVTKRKPLTIADFNEFLNLLPSRGDSERSWTVTREEIEAKNFDLKAVNPNAKFEEDAETPQELLDFIELKGQEVAAALSILRQWE